MLDLRLVQFCLALPPWPWCVGKHLLRESMRGRLPEEVLARPKTPMPGHPHLPLLARAGHLDRWLASDALGRYVYRGSIPAVSEAGAASGAWLNLRPFSLDSWLHHLDTVSKEGVDERES